MRLIDADAFDKMLIQAQSKCKKIGGNFRFGVLGNVRANLALFPTVDRPEIVRCKECAHWIPGTITDKDDFIQPRCKRNGGGWSSDDYCSCAERREEACTSNCTN